ncbi:MAG: hypothetical protein ABI670_18845 [Chloroflexota bacterium]
MTNAGQDNHSADIAPADMPRIGTIDERYQSYNVEMVEVIGGRFWKPYSPEVRAILDAQQKPTEQSEGVPVGMDPDMYQQRAPIDLTNPRLRKMAEALGPAYVRVSGTWANTVYFHDSDTPPPSSPPEGFGGILTRQQWKGMVDFSHAVDAKIVTSFSTGVGTRDSNGVWTPEQARHILDFTKSVGGTIAAAEFMNEPTIAGMGGAPEGYDAADYGRDLAVFHPFMRQAAPNMRILGPGSVGESAPTPGSSAPAMSAVPTIGAGFIKTEDMLKATGPIFDVFSYHFYGAASKRCEGTMPQMATTAEAALSEEWLSRTDATEVFYESLRDKYQPGKPLWNTETADAACGGNPWASTFLDSFRYLDQLGRLARRGLQVIIHNTLASSDYGLLDENTFAPRPNYWAALLWRRLMGTTVLDPRSSPATSLHLYAHCLRDQSGGVALLVINTDRTASQELTIPMQSERYTLSANKDLQERSVQLNGRILQLEPNDDLPALKGEPTPAGRVTFSPATITFLAMPDAGNEACEA